MLVLALLLVQPAAASSYPITISYGRSWPLSIVADSTRGLVYVDASSGEYPPTGFSFGVVNVTDHQLVKVMGLSVLPGPMAIDEATGDVYVAGTDTIAVFDGTSQSFARNLTLGVQILDMAYDGSVSQNIYVTAGDEVLAVDSHNGAVVANATVAEGPNDMVLDPADGRLYVSEYLSAKIAVFQASTLAPAGEINLDSCCATDLALDGGTQTLYASTGTNFVDIVNAATDTFEKSVQVAPSEQNSTNSIVVDSETGRVYVASSPGGSIIELEGPGGGVVGNFRALGQVAGLAIDSVTHELYATNYHQITAFDTKGGETSLLTLSAVAVAGAVFAVSAYWIVAHRSRAGKAGTSLTRHQEGSGEGLGGSGRWTL